MESVESRDRSALLRDMHSALLFELGARTFYRLFARRVRDAELAQVLARFHEEQREQIDRLRAVIAELGGRAPRTSYRRALTARILYLTTFCGASRIALRFCYESECAVMRWYHRYADYLAVLDLHAARRTCLALALTKERHARILEAWVAR